MQEPRAEPFNWRNVHWVVVMLVLGLYLFTVRTILNPFLLFFLLVFVISPYSGTRFHLLLVSATGLLTFIWVLDTTGFLLAPFVLALVLGYVLHPLVARLVGKRVSRTMAVMVLALPLLGVIALLVFVGIPALSAQATEFIRGTPELVKQASARLEAIQLDLSRRGVPGFDEASVQERIASIQPEAVMAWLQERQSAIATAVWRGVLGVGRGLGTVLSILSYVFLTPVLTFYLLRDWPAIEAKAGELVPAPYREKVFGFAREYDRLLSGYMRGQLLEAAIVGVLTWLGLLIAGFPYALLLGVVAGVFNVIPYMGLVASLVPGLVIVVFSANPLVALAKLGIVFVIVQLIDGTFLGPKIVGDSVGLHPVWVLLALAVCGFFFGFVGLLIAVPLAVLVKLVLRMALERYRASRLFQGDRQVLAME